ncbi:MAG: TIGR03668 family PPOX class F420-dependent oxidoreductase [Acetobacteraceae bacterium]|nr:TIGR03668 family PPOX class F420-dependent oxidoreductase [Acetobacteraceae bacterium]
MTPAARRFVEARRVAHLATADAAGVPQVVPVCFALSGDHDLYIAVDAKPKRGDPARLKRLRNIAENPRVALVFDRYEEDWARLGWVMLRGRAEILPPGAPEHAEAQALLRARYAQYAAMDLGPLPVIAVRIETARAWGRLDPPPP